MSTVKAMGVAVAEGLPNRSTATANKACVWPVARLANVKLYCPVELVDASASHSLASVSPSPLRSKYQTTLPLAGPTPEKAGVASDVAVALHRVGVGSSSSAVGGLGWDKRISISRPVSRLARPKASTLLANKTVFPEVTLAFSTSAKVARYCHRPCASAVTFMLPTP